MNRPLRTSAARILALFALTSLASGCAHATLRDVPMPGLVTGPKYEVTAVFRNVLGLPEQAAVKLNGATIGEVGRITTKDYLARVSLRIGRDYTLPADVRAEIRFASPMSEAFVELTDPAGGAGTLAPGGVIPVAATSEAPSIGDLLAATSTLVTGGSFADMKVVITELNTALSGNGENIQDLIDQLDGMVTRLNDHTAEFDASLVAMEALSTDLADDRKLFGEALETMEPAITTLSDQRHEIFALMKELRQLSAVGTSTLRSTRDDMLSILADLGPILETLTQNEAQFRQIMDGIQAFSAATTSATYGLFLNFDLTTIFDQDALSSTIGALPSGAPGAQPGAQPDPSAPATQPGTASSDPSQVVPPVGQPTDLSKALVDVLRGVLGGGTP